MDAIQYARAYEAAVRYASRQREFATFDRDAQQTALNQPFKSPEEATAFEKMAEGRQVFADHLQDENDPREEIVRRSWQSYLDNSPAVDRMSKLYDLPTGPNAAYHGWHHLGSTNSELPLPDGTGLNFAVWRHVPGNHHVVSLGWKVPTEFGDHANYEGDFRPDEARELIDRIAPEHADRVHEFLNERLGSRATVLVPPRYFTPRPANTNSNSTEG